MDSDWIRLEFNDQEPCYKCGTPTTRRSRLNGEGRLDKDAPFRSVCNKCGPQYTITAEKVGGEWQPLDEPVPLEIVND
jgi:hypothetical protein